MTSAPLSDLEPSGSPPRSRALGEAGVSCNVIAGVHHDPLFVPVERADDAMAALHTLQARSAA